MSAIFPLVHFHIHLFVTNPSGQEFDILSDPFPPYNAAIDFTYNFSKDSSPQDTSVTIHGLTREHAKKYFVKGAAVTVYAGWANSDYSQNNYQCIFSEKITTVNPMINNSGDWQLSFICTDGQKLGQGETSLSKIYRSKSVRNDASTGSRLKSGISAITKKYLGKKKYYRRLERQALATIPKGKRGISGNARRAIRQKFGSIVDSLNSTEKRKRTSASGRYHREVTNRKNQNAKNKSKANKHKNGKHFKKGTRASTIIRVLAGQAHIHIDKIKLVHDKRYNSGYTADKKPWQCIQDVANDCDSAIWWPHGKLTIADFSKHLPSGFVLTPKTGLIETPQKQDDTDSSSNLPTYQANAIFLPGVTTGSTFRIKDPINPLIAPGKEPIQVGSLFNNEVTVLSGSVGVDSGSTPTSNLTVTPTSDEKKAETAKVKNKNKKIKDKKDARSRRRTKAKRHARQSRRR